MVIAGGQWRAGKKCSQGLYLPGPSGIQRGWSDDGILPRHLQGPCWCAEGLLAVPKTRVTIVEGGPLNGDSATFGGRTCRLFLKLALNPKP